MPANRVKRVSVTAEEKLVSVTCNCCGKTEESRSGYVPAGFHLSSFSGGYGSDFPGDLDSFEFVICDQCLKSWTETWQIPPKIVSALYHKERVTNSETGEDYVVCNGVCYSADDERGFPYELEGTISEWEQEHCNFLRACKVWRHYKGKHYLVIDSLWDREGTVFVYYQELYGDSKRWIRPIESWFEEISPDCYRFEPVLILDEE